MRGIIVLFVLLVSGFVFAQSPASSVAPSAVPAVVQHANDATNALDSHMGLIVTGLGILSEAVMRAWPTKQPLSWFSLAASVLTALGLLFSKLGTVFNNVVAQENAKKSG